MPTVKIAKQQLPAHVLDMAAWPSVGYVDIWPWNRQRMGRPEGPTCQCCIHNLHEEMTPTLC